MGSDREMLPFILADACLQFLHPGVNILVLLANCVSNVFHGSNAWFELWLVQPGYLLR